MQKIALKKAISCLGSKAQLAKKIGASRAAINYWLKKECGEGDDLLSPLFATRIELTTNHHVKRSDLCPKTYVPLAEAKTLAIAPTPKKRKKNNDLTINMEFMD